MVLPFKLPHAGLQSLRQRLMYWRIVYYYRFALQHDLYNRKPLHKFARFFIAVLAIKALEKGARGQKEEHLHDYNARKANIEATERALWDDELAVHSINVAEAEQGVFRQRAVDWMFRSDPAGFAKVMTTFSFPFRVSSTAVAAAPPAQLK